MKAILFERLRAAALLVFVATVFAGCSLFTKQNAKTVLDIVQVACVIENEALGDADIAKVCGVADALIPDMRKLLAEHRKGVAKQLGHPYRGVAP